MEQSPIAFLLLGFWHTLNLLLHIAILSLFSYCFLCFKCSLILFAKYYVAAVGLLKVIY